MKSIFILLFIIFSLKLYNQEAVKNDSIEIFEKSNVLFGVDYKIIFPQKPFSEKYNLNDVNTAFTSFSADFAYAWYLNKKNKNSILLFKLAYSNLKSKTNIENKNEELIKSKIPDYIYNIPNIHNFDLNLIFSQKLKRNWDFIVSYNLIFSSDFKSMIEKEDLNSVALFFIEKKLGKFGLGFGSAVYIIDKKIQALPVVKISYVNHKINIDLLPPLSLSVDYKLGKKNFLNFNSNLLLNGFNVDYNQSNSQKNFGTPDYINNTGIDFSFGFDRRFFENLHWKISTGYSYQEISYLENKNIIDKQIFQNGMSFSVSFYAAF